MCDANANCVEEDDWFKCVCDDGFAGNGEVRLNLQFYLLPRLHMQV